MVALPDLFLELLIGVLELLDYQLIGPPHPVHLPLMSRGFLFQPFLDNKINNTVNSGGQCCGSRSGIRPWVLFDPWIRDPE